ncbi:MAG: LPXTG cell wall anchor domain-containing protein [Oscillospiraceae bacterium]|nr:LPXTG cell wall anchor domain-containing protein [Oscillospiraceae bacterium]
MSYLLPLSASPLTGDDRDVIMYIIIAAIAAALIVIFILLGKKTKK